MDNTTMIVKAIGEQNKTLSRIERRLGTLASPIEREERRRAMEQHPSYSAPASQSGTLMKTVPIELDWFVPGIKTKASFIRRNDGHVTITIDILGEDGDIVEDLLSSLPVEYLQLSEVVKD